MLNMLEHPGQVVRIDVLINSISSARRASQIWIMIISIKNGLPAVPNKGGVLPVRTSTRYFAHLCEGSRLVAQPTVAYGARSR